MELWCAWLHSHGMARARLLSSPNFQEKGQKSPAMHLRSKAKYVAGSMVTGKSRVTIF